nr:DUF2243 domain-containing protein [Salicibibacter halophilus]
MTHRTYPNYNLWSGILFGIGMMAFIDEALFHLLLQWHHFYDRSTTEIGLMSEGLLHAFSWFATIASLFMLAGIKKRNGFWLKRWGGGVLLGAGIFQFYDGIVQHKLMRIHQVRYVDNLIVYDLVWILAAVLMIVGGAFLIKRTKQSGLKGSL